MQTSNYIREDIFQMKAYSSARSKYSPDLDMTFLDANEYGSGTYMRYPEPQPRLLVERLSNLYGVSPDNLLVTRGADEGIECVIKAACLPGRDSIGVFEPTYDMYRKTAEILNVKTIELDLNSTLSRYLPGVIFLCRPNNPTGEVVDRESILSLLEVAKNKSLVVLDEAYIEFSDEESLSPLVSAYENLVVLRTLSKAYSSAGLRLGSVIARPEIIEQLFKVIAPYPIPSPVVEFIEKTPLDFDKKSFTLEKCRVEESLNKSKLVDSYLNSSSNFFLCKSSSRAELLNKALDKNIVLRDRDSKVPDTVRISIGSSNENAKLAKLLKEEPR